MWYILVLPGLQAIPFEMHTSVTFRVRVCVTGGRGREGERTTLGGVPVCMCMYVLYMCVYVSLCICVGVHV